ncbi:histidine-rich glycoprotein-like [Aedes aegypti]|uniref:Uncharacterized protein n=1 Tax=Aedes aegypti TaxID=7159 RepID=A0A6I8U368_AEDAE|nr:histidine-rich glycoprotein-like [Aedes aegypti]
MFKFILLLASLAYASAGHVDSHAAPIAANYAPAAAVSYSTVTRTHSLPVAHGNAHSNLHHGYIHSHNNHHVYGHNFAPAHSYEDGYAQYLANDHYGYSRHGAPLIAKHVTVAHVPVHHHHAYADNVVAAPVLAAHGYNYGGAHHLGYNNHHGHHGY